MTNLKDEFERFKSVTPVAPPGGLSEQVLSKVHADLNPGAWSVFSKLVLIHLVTGTLTLAVCPQFGIRLLGDGHGLMAYLMFLGRHGCIAACGAFFLGSSLLAAGVILRPEELRVLRRRRVLQLASLTLLSLGAFVMLQAEILFGFALAWMFGSVMGGLALLETGWMIRVRRRAQ